MSDFRDVIKEKVSSLSFEKEKLMKLATNTGFHASKAREAVEAAIPSLQDFDGSLEELKLEAVSLLSQVPNLVQDTWAYIADEIKQIDSEISKWSEMYSLYDEWDKASVRDVPASTTAADELSEKIKSGEIKEPSKMTAMRRKVGTRPPTTLSQYRRAQTSGGEDLET